MQECDASFSKKILEEKHIESVHEEKKPHFDTYYENIKKEILPCPSVEGTSIFIFIWVKWQYSDPLYMCKWSSGWM